MRSLTGAPAFRWVENVGEVKSACYGMQDWLALSMGQLHVPDHLHVFNNYTLCDDNLRLSDVQAQKSRNMRIIYSVDAAALKHWPTASISVEADHVGRTIKVVKLPSQSKNV